MTEKDCFALYFGIRVDLMLDGSRDCMEEELRKYKVKRLVAKVCLTDRFTSYLEIRLVFKLEWGS
ncbi:uncharacterized protein G2W53_040169 [Senna tora]|uniref:Uncharacterized protein n=1 Tax=Senna tora TaxID=362788 RepID=A0A834W4A3_9FABA|nr:uncharacterized protein G2W53_040169 [Senna tora]